WQPNAAPAFVCPLRALARSVQALRSQAAPRASISRANGDGERDPRSASYGAAALAAPGCAGNFFAGCADRARDRARPAIFRRQEPRILDPADDRLDRLFPAAHAVRHRQFDGLDVAGPHAASDSNRLFAYAPDGVP